MIDKILLKKLKKDAVKLNPILRLGKNGLTESVLSEINLLLKKRKLLKIKLLKSFVMQISTQDALKKILEYTHANLILKTGNVLVIYKDYKTNN